MAQTKTKTGEAYQVYREWLNELRKELKDIRKKCDQLDGIEPLKLKLDSLEVEAMLNENFGSNMESMSKL